VRVRIGYGVLHWLSPVLLLRLLLALACRLYLPITKQAIGNRQALPAV
jgi:hypothetical protein